MGTRHIFFWKSSYTFWAVDKFSCHVLYRYTIRTSVTLKHFVHRRCQSSISSAAVADTLLYFYRMYKSNWFSPTGFHHVARAIFHASKSVLLYLWNETKWLVSCVPVKKAHPTINQDKHGLYFLIFFFVLVAESVVLLGVGPPSQSQQQVED